MAENKIKENKKDKFTKPGYDARLEYTELLRGRLEVINMYSSNRSFDGWLRELFVYFNLIAGFITPDDEVKINTTLKDLNNTLNYWKHASSKNNHKILNSMDILFRDATRLIIKASKHLLLPIKDDDEDEYDSATFFRGSDL